MSNEYEEALANQVKAALYDHFKDHNETEITPVEWNDAVVQIVIRLQEETPTTQLLQALAQEQAAEEDRELFYQEGLLAAKREGIIEGINQALVSLKSFSDSAPRLGPDDRKDVSGVLRAISILSQELP